jgi:hypothetical protein
MESRQRINLFLLFGVGVLFLWACEGNKFQDRFETNIPNHKMQYFEIDLESDTIFITKNNALLIIPQCAFVLGGKVISNQKIIVEFSELYKPIDFVEAHLSTITDRGELLESAGMFYLQAKTLNNEQLEINPKCSPLLRFGSKDMKPNLQHYKGVMENGEVVWTTPQELEKWLTAVPLEKLSLYANPDKKYKISFSKEGDFLERKKILIQTEPFSNYCGLKNELIDILYTSEYENTFIATWEFELRMRCIHQTCSKDVLQIYLSNLDKNLYRADSLVYQLLLKENSEHAQNFKCFYEQKLTRVPNGNNGTGYANLRNIEESIDLKIKNAMLKNLIYHTLKFSNMGFHNVDALSRYPDLIEAKDEFELVMNSNHLTQAAVYCISKNYNSVSVLHFDDTSNRYRFDNTFCEKNVAIYAVVSDGDKNYSCVKEVELGKIKSHKLVLATTTLEEIGATLSSYGLYREDNLFTFPTANCCFSELKEL